MKFPIENNQISTRVTAEELEFLNELIGKLFAEQDWTDPTLTMRTVIMRIAETAEMKLTKTGQSKPEDLARIKELENQVKEVVVEFESFKKELVAERSEVENLKSEISEKTETISQLTEQLAGIDGEKTAISEKVQKLEKYAPVPNERRIIIAPLTAKVLDLYSEKIRLRTKTEISSGEILTSLFNRYITKRETELPGFPFLVTREEIVSLKNELENE